LTELRNRISFTIDSALLRELGERLVGKPHIALAELVKNSYDADARQVEIRMLPDRIEIRDNGHGMTFEEFQNFWMRIGTPHKQEQRVSRHFHRPLTGSKGVGRLAVQFLAREMVICTVAEATPNRVLEAYVNWEESIQVGQLTEACALYDADSQRKEDFPAGSEHGTVVILTNLNQDWSPKGVTELAQEIWSLQPPFRANPRVSTNQGEDFVVEFQSSDPEMTKQFEAQIRAYLSLWEARLVGELVERDAQDPEHPIGRIRLALEFADRPGEVSIVSYEVRDCPLRFAEFELRVYSWAGRQKFGVKVGEVRAHFEKFGGVHIYDAGFHLPYYGSKTSDWLGIERDHSHRLSESKLLPVNLQAPRGLNNLPTTSRLFGVVHVDTAAERHEALPASNGRPPECLEIQVTRDRLVENLAFKSLRDLVRWSLDYYAMEQTRRKLSEAEAKRPTDPTSTKVENLERVLDRFESEMPATAFMELKARVREAADATQSEAEIIVQKTALLAPLATAGMCALAYEHEVGKQFQILKSVASRLKGLLVSDPAIRSELDSIRANIETWIDRAKATRALFSHLTSPEHNENRDRLKARNILEMVKDQVHALVRDLPVDTRGIDPELRLPEGTLSEWSALFQNVLINASNALLDSRRKQVVVRSERSGRGRSILIEDTGTGVDLDSADELFEPFVRRQEISTARRSLGLGGSGLGLTIVRMIADNVGCRVGFVEPSKGFSTCFELAWKERP